MSNEIIAMPANYSQFVTQTHELFGGTRVELKFPNGWGASIINHKYSYGVELAVLDSKGDISYNTPITDDVLTWLTPETLTEALEAIKAL